MQKPAPWQQGRAFLLVLYRKYAQHISTMSIDLINGMGGKERDLIGGLVSPMRIDLIDGMGEKERDLLGGDLLVL